MRICEECRAYLDPQEKCDCEIEREEEVVEEILDIIKAARANGTAKVNITNQL